MNEEKENGVWYTDSIGEQEPPVVRVYTRRNGVLTCSYEKYITIWEEALRSRTDVEPLVTKMAEVDINDLD